MSIEPLDDTEKAYFQTILNGGHPEGGVKITLLRMQTVDGDPVAIVCAVLEGTPGVGYQPLAMLLTDEEQVKMLRSIDGSGPELADAADFATGDPTPPVPLGDPDEEIRIPAGHEIRPPFTRDDVGRYCAICPCGIELKAASDAMLLEKVISHWKAQG